MKGSFTIIRPVKQRSKSALMNNMFQDPDKSEEDNVKSRQNVESYDFVGSTQIRKKILSRNSVSAKSELKQKQIQQPSPFNQTANSKNPMNSTINQNTMLSSLHKDQLTQFTKQSNNLRRYKEYQQVWDKTKNVIKSQTHKKNPILMDSNIKSLYVHPNEDKNDIINNYVVHYWQMSLRNNNPILQAHIKGHNFGKVEKQKLLQLREGTKRIQESIPILPIEKLNSFRQRRQISLSGRNKIKRQIQIQSEKTQTKFSFANNARLSNQQVFKINYQGPKKWMGSQNL